MLRRQVMHAVRLAVAAGVFLLAQPGAAPAQQAPITVVVAVAAGGSSDIGLRTIAAKVEELGGPRIVVEARPGGGGVTGAVGVRDAAPDGRTLLLASYATHMVSPALPGGAPYDPIADFQPITNLFSFPVMLAVPATVEAKTVQELIALAKRKPGGLSYASQGVGTAGHLLGELFARSSGASLLHVPYRGAAPAVIDLVAGRVDMMFVGVLPSQGHLASGALRALAVTSKTRMPEVPHAPTMVEIGHASVDSDFVWFGLMAPAKTPDAVVKNLHDLFTRAANAPDVKAKLAAQGINVGTSTPQELTARIKEDSARFAPIIKASGAIK